MPFEGYTIDETIKSKPSENIGIRVPEGDYLLEIVGCVPSAIDKPAAYSWRMKIIAGAAGVGQQLSMYCSMKDSNPTLGKKSTFFNLGILVASALDEARADQLQDYLLGPGNAKNGGQPTVVKTYDDHVKFGELLLAKLKGHQVYGLVGDTESGGRIYSNVTRVGPPSMYAGPTAPTTTSKPANGATPANAVTASAELQSSVNEMFAGLQAV